MNILQYRGIREIESNTIYYSNTDIDLYRNTPYRGCTDEGIDGDKLWALPLHSFVTYYQRERQSKFWGMNSDCAAIVFALEDYEIPPLRRVLNNVQLGRIERAIKKIFPQLSGYSLNRLIVTSDNIKTLFPPLISNSPFTTSKNLNTKLWALPFQITELFFRTIIDFIVNATLSVYGYINEDKAEYLKMRLSITHNDAFRAIWGNIYSNLSK